MAACFIVQLVTFSGIFAAAGVSSFARLRNMNGQGLWKTIQEKIIPSFAAGALLATVVFLMLPEGMVLLSGGHDDHDDDHADDHDDHDHLLRRLATEEDNHDDDGMKESEFAWKFGAYLLSGILVPILLSSVFPGPDKIMNDCGECQDEKALADIHELSLNDHDGEDAKSANHTTSEGCEQADCEEEGDRVVSAPAIPASLTLHTSKNYALAASILLGDFVHNFADGVFIGNAFLLCDSTVGFTIAASTVYHELPQEVADYALLTQHCGLPSSMALSLNFVSGFSVYLGAILVFFLDFSEATTGGILILSAGVFIYIAACECIPRFLSQHEGKDSWTFFFWFLVGAIPIGLVLLNHGHCDAH